MDVLHAIWHKKGLAFWGESSEEVLRGPSRHPYTRDVLPFIRELSGASIGDGEPAGVHIFLPSTVFGPIPSPHLVHDWDFDVDGDTELLPWRVQARCWSPVDTFYFLQHLYSDDELRSSIQVGTSVRYWQQVAHFILSLLIRQSVLPALIHSERTYKSRWDVVLHSMQALNTFESLAKAMPPVCRAHVEPGRDARGILREFIQHLGDSVIRSWLPKRIPVSVEHPEPVTSWVENLVAKEGTKVLHGISEPFYEAVKAWRTKGFGTGNERVQVAFRLEAPIFEEEDPCWRLHYLLRSRDDLSLLITADAIWNEDLSSLRQYVEKPHEILLAGLGYAGRIFDPLRRELKTARPTHAVLTAKEAYTFLRECAPLLEEAGFGVLTPPWWNAPGSRLGVRLKLKKRSASKTESGSTGFLSMENLIHFSWRLSVGETELTAEEFEMLVALKSPMVQLRGRWVQLDPEQVEKAIRFWEKYTHDVDRTLWEAMPEALGGLTEIAGMPIDAIEMDDELQLWFDRVRGQASLESINVPGGLQATLRPYQRHGFEWLDFLHQSGMGACLADDMGLGKTIQTLTLLLHLKAQDRLNRPVLLIAPTSVVTNWYKEAHRFTPGLNSYVHQGADRLNEQAFRAHVVCVDLVLTSYAIARRDADLLQSLEWSVVVLDEAQHIKNSHTQQTRVIRKLNASFRLALTGTPVENRLTELWSIMHFLNPGYLGSLNQFKEVFANPIERYNDRVAIQQLRALTQPFILRRLKTDPQVISDLPEKQELKVYCKLSDEQATLYEAVVRDALHQVEITTDPMARRGMVLSMLMKLKQVCNHPSQFLHQVTTDALPGNAVERSGKMIRLVELQEEILAAGGTSLLFTQFTEMGHLLRYTLQEELGVPVLFLHGGTAVKKREVLVRQFQEEGGAPIFILSLKAGGTGLNLTRANHVFHFDRWWNPAVENQATDRAFRIGQDRKVMVHKFICSGTLEERIDDMIEHKKSIAEQVVGHGDSWITELSTDALRNLVFLRDTMMA